ncbi:hypothetical protein NQD34_014116, partial [Periophthalmus magnuspinnatus]
KQRRSSNQNNVENPKSVLGNWECQVITHLLASRLKGVTSKFFLFIL